MRDRCVGKIGPIEVSEVPVDTAIAKLAPRHLSKPRPFKVGSRKVAVLGNAKGRIFSDCVCKRTLFEANRLKIKARQVKSVKLLARDRD
ncbi:MAG TPA: hypothetical protein VFW23_17155 [Tepidisphaeraceae bacterium]|nr:hypothetical protein [Tepidisphaeraceae bacterium]